MKAFTIGLIGGCLLAAGTVRADDMNSSEDYLRVQRSENIPYVSGGVGIEERHQLKSLGGAGSRAVHELRLPRRSQGCGGFMGDRHCAKLDVMLRSRPVERLDPHLACRIIAMAKTSRPRAKAILVPSQKSIDRLKQKRI